MKNTELLKRIVDSRISVLGLGVSNKCLVSFLLKHGATDITVHDKKPYTELGNEALEFFDKGVKFISGEDYLLSIDGEYIFRTPGIRDDAEGIVKAVENGGELLSEMELFYELTPATIIAITGSDGKTTTTTLTSLILREELSKKGNAKVYPGGNIGTPLLPMVEEMTFKDYCVVELSSFQLKTMKKSPQRAAITNITPNHLDWHTDINEYIESKLNICRGKELERLVTNRDNDITGELGKAFERPVTLVSSTKDDFFEISEEGHGKKAIFERDGEIIISDGTLERVMLKISDIRLVGRHNVENYMTAIALLDGLVGYESIRKVAREFGGVEHRLELVRELGGVKYYNSSIDTSPTRTEAALSAFEEKVIVICGGYDKHIPFTHLGDVLCQKAKAVVLTGATRYAILSAIKDSPYYSDSGISVHLSEHFFDAVDSARKKADAGDTVILSPACASFDEFRNFEERGNVFKNIINSIVEDEKEEADA